MAVTVETLVRQLADSGIVAPGKLESFVPPKAHPKDGEQLLRELFKQNLLTKFQAQQFAQGRGKSLILGNYTILEKIGAGGMGQVFKAEHRRLKRVVAIKMLPSAVAKDPLTVARFQREVEAAARLRHPNIVATDDADEAGGVHFMSMEYVEGQDLSALVKKHGPLSTEKAVDCILQAARGLEFAHRKGVIHRDIKPSNLLLDAEGTVKILDMGLARIHTGGDAATQAELTGTGAVMGTVDYMAPEQARNTHQADARADIYSLGCSLFYLLTARPLYAGDTITNKLISHQFDPTPSWREVRDDVPEAVEVIFRKMVAKAVEDRYQSMSEVIADLQTAVPGAAAEGAAQSSSSNSNLSFLNEMPARTVQRTTAVTEPNNIPATGRFLNRKFALLAAGVASLLVVLISLALKAPRSASEAPLSPDDSHAPLSPRGRGVGGERANVTADSSSSSADGTRRVPATLVAPFDAAQAREHQEAWAAHLGTQVETTNPIGMKMILIPPGAFLMGSTDEQVEAALKLAEETNADVTKIRIRDAERPQHRVRITRPFLMGQMEVTIGQFQKFAQASGYQTEAEIADLAAKAATEQPARPGQPAPAPYKPTATYLTKAKSDKNPAGNLTWNDAVAFCMWLSEQDKLEPPYGGTVGKWTKPTGKGYHLPTEAQWEYACRAGTTTQYSFGDDVNRLKDYAWYDGAGVHAVGLKLPNAFALHDMHGNLYEWCQDWYDAKWYGQSPANDPIASYSGDNRVIRGGSFANSNAPFCRSASRNNLPSSYRYPLYGFRVVREW